MRIEAQWGVFTECIQQWHQERAREYGFPDGKTGGVAVLHRFNSALMLQPHIHSLLIDGVYTPDGVLHPFRAPDEAHLRALCERINQRVTRMLRRAGAVKVDENDPMKACTQLALFAGARVPEKASAPARRPAGNKLAVEIGGFNLEATTVIAAHDRDGLERMCRYLLRGPLALDRLSIDDDGTARYALKRPDRHGRTTLVLSPHELIARMTALMPLPHLCLRRVFGVLAPRSALRKLIVPGRDVAHPGPEREEKSAAPPTRTP